MPEMRTSDKSLRSKRAGASQRRKGPTALRWELQSSHSHQNKNTRVPGVFILVKRGIGFESRNHLIAGSTMSCCVARCAAAHNIRMPRSPTHQRGRGNQPLPPENTDPLWSVFVSWRYGCFTNAQFQCLVSVP